MTATRMSKAERSAPVVLAVAMFVLVALLLPTVLRPVDPLTNEAAEFSPDAPPDEQESIVEALNRGTSATAGTGEGQGASVGEGEPGQGAGVQPPPPPDVPPVEAPASRGKCFGNPPRQVESVYAPPCAPAFVGDNGGATHDTGVTATEFRVAVYVIDIEDVDEGPVEGAAYENETQRYLLAMQNWFNKHFEFYGRQMRIFVVKQSLTSSSQGAAAAVRAKQQYQVFAAGDALTTNPGTFGESMNQGIVTVMGYVPDKLLESNRPYGWAFLQAVDRTADMATETICKQVVGKPPAFNQQMDDTFDYGAPRKLGLLLYEDSLRAGLEGRIKDAIAKCGGKIEHTVKFAFEDQNAAGVAGAMTQMRAQGVTTLLHFGEHASVNVFTAEATRLDYWPEWFVAGVGGADVNSLTQDQDQRQWAHAFGISALEIPRAPQFREDIKAVREMDPSSNYSGAGALSFAQIFTIASGVQSAGPTLNPTSFEKGMFKLRPRAPDPLWSVGGGYAPGDRSYIDYVMLMYWDPAVAAADNGAKGSYRYLYDGQHFTYGEIPEEPAPWFQGGITTPADPTIKDKDRTAPG